MVVVQLTTVRFRPHGQTTTHGCATNQHVMSACVSPDVGDISISAISRNRQQWFAYPSEFWLETSCKGLLAAMTSNNTLANLLPDLATLLKIYLTLPSTCCEAEISFSVLRRLKNYMRTTMSQNRLNHLCILSVYKNIVDTLGQSQLVDEFVMRNEQRQARFALGVTTDTKTRKPYLS